MGRLRHYLQVWLFATLACLLSPAHAYLVCVVSSERAPAYQDAADSLSQELVRNGVARQDIQSLSLVDYLEGGAAVQDTRLIVSLGADAFRQVLAHSSRSVVLAGLIPRISFERLLADSHRKNPANVAGLYLDQPFGRQLDLLHMALPAVRRVGVLWGPESVAQQPLLASALQSRGLESTELVLAEGGSLIAALRGALNNTEALLAVADSAVYNPSTISNILLTSYRDKTPVMAFSPGYVKAGALLSVHSTATQAGVQMATMALHYLQANALPTSQYPLDFSISVNEYVAHSLGLSLDAKNLTDRLRRLEKKP
jgi:ABC-type uncharacterized transport system substrate-binding protein